MSLPNQVAFLRTSAALFGLCALVMTTGCSYISHATDKITGTSERTIPDTGMVPLGAKRVPVLNPGGVMFNASAGLEEQKLAAENPYLNEGMKVVSPNGAAAAAYDQSVVQGQQSGSWKGNVFYGNGAADSSARRMPGENQASMMQPPTVMAAPVAPLAPIPPAYNAELAPVVVPPQPLGAVARDGYPDLAATPPAPIQANNYQSNMSSLVAERELAENMRREMMQNPGMAEPGMVSPGMPSPGAAIASAPPPAPAPQNAGVSKSDPEFSGWLKKMFTEEDNKPNVQQQAYSAEQRKPIASAYAAPEPQMQVGNLQAGLEPIVLTPPPGAEPMPPMTPPMQMASAAPVGAPPMEPITLSPPPPVAGDFSASGLDASAEPIMLQPPVAAVSRNTRFLPDGRYATRRGASRMAMAR